MVKIPDNTIYNKDKQQKQVNKKLKSSRLANDTLETHEEKHIRLGNEFVQWCKDIRERYKQQPKKIFTDIEDFLIEKDLPSGTYDDWYNNDLAFKELIDEGKKYLGIHLFAGTAEKSLDIQQVNKLVVRYNKKYKECDDYEDERDIKKIKARAEATQPPQNLHITVYDGQQQKS